MNTIPIFATFRQYCQETTYPEAETVKLWVTDVSQVNLEFNKYGAFSSVSWNKVANVKKCLMQFFYIIIHLEFIPRNQNINLVTRA